MVTDKIFNSQQREYSALLEIHPVFVYRYLQDPSKITTAMFNFNVVIIIVPAMVRLHFKDRDTRADNEN